MKPMLVIASVIGLLACSPQGTAQNDANLNTAHLERMGFVVESADESSIAGVYEVITDQGLVYVTADGKTLIGGRLYDITGDEPVNVSEVAIQDMRRNDLAQIVDETIYYKADNEDFVITVFTDPTCGYCRQLHSNLQQYHDVGISVRYLGWPRMGLQGEGYEQLKAIWCADDKAAALTAAKNDQPLSQRSCDHPVDRHFALGSKFGIRGTPAIVLPSGEMLPGLVPAQRLLGQLENGQ
ncbi:Thiol:disulfide interchange protein DsbC [Pseudidiomarina piscicola]|uniref:Thiol:disulfide interchange protein n=1 Tax=Pseudidiomarina piscicola TaxID=2614830 RepID=A0A6S6WJB5_9GAMM|nr:bifunctional protein-disulfide isomerase/oxidoreductase DsbC [Pseudidiomarina piscicola]CAB0149831.1 Thiol:disulfide interchange protein DsbC [Pseudidiomarina piscicola]VZT39277.1 Thiol:disulfide interchange protein DsbC [Pseudomonas aeruginosa]